MQFEQELVPGKLIKRYKRFLADIELDSGTIITAHTANTGSMLGCSTPGSRVWVSNSQSKTRKYPYSWQLVESETGTIVGINTSLPNLLVKEGIESGVISELQGYDNIRSEVRYGTENSRIDLLLEDKFANKCYVEVKNVTLVVDTIAMFPDAVSKRGVKHLRELAGMVNNGFRAIIFFCVQRNDANEVHPADHIDPDYGKTLRQVISCGVEAIAYYAEINTKEVNLQHKIPVICPD